MNGILLPGINTSSRVSLSAYADDITAFIMSQNDVDVAGIIRKYENASSAKMNWGKSEGLIIGQWGGLGPPKLPGGVLWVRERLKFFGIFLGNTTFKG